MPRIILFLTLLVLIQAGWGHAAQEEPIKLEEVVVTATRTEVPAEQLSSSVTVIGREEIERKKAATIQELLRDVKGVDVHGFGGPGSQVDVRIRGGNPSHTLVLVDGVRVNSPTSGDFSFATLTTDSVERIEVVRGPMSTLYGSFAAGGVIHIITKRGSGPPTFNLLAEGGAFKTAREVMEVSGGTDRFDYSLGLSRFDTHGISRANRRHGNREADGHEQTTVSTQLGLALPGVAKLTGTFRYIDAFTDLDVSRSGVQVDDPRVQDSREAVASISLSNPFTDFWDQSLQFFLYDRFFEGRRTARAADRFKIDLQNRGLDWQNNFALGENTALTSGYTFEQQSGENKGKFSERSVETHAGYLQSQFRFFDPLFFNAGLRLDHHNKFGEELTYKVGAAWLFRSVGTKLYANYGTGFKAPTINDLFFPDFGNPNLKPETSQGYELGLEQQLLDKKLQARVSYFSTRFEDLIVSTFNSTLGRNEAQNVQKATAQGVEFELNVAPLSWLRFDGNYTYLETEDESTGRALPRRPRNKASMGAAFLPLPDLSLRVNVRYVGKRLSSSTSGLNRYTVASLISSYDIAKNVQLFFRIDNLFDKKYEEVRGFGAAPRSAYGGLKFSFSPWR
jgi:vitamin B12 transporter